MLSQTVSVNPRHRLNLQNWAQIEPICELVQAAVGGGSFLPSIVQDLNLFCMTAAGEISDSGELGAPKGTCDCPELGLNEAVSAS